MWWSFILWRCFELAASNLSFSQYLENKTHHPNCLPPSEALLKLLLFNDWFVEYTGIDIVFIHVVEYFRDGPNDIKDASFPNLKITALLGGAHHEIELHPTTIDSTIIFSCFAISVKWVTTESKSPKSPCHHDDSWPPTMSAALTLYVLVPISRLVCFQNIARLRLFYSSVGFIPTTTVLCFSHLPPFFFFNILNLGVNRILVSRAWNAPFGGPWYPDHLQNRLWTALRKTPKTHLYLGAFYDCLCPQTSSELLVLL